MIGLKRKGLGTLVITKPGKGNLSNSAIFPQAKPEGGGGVATLKIRTRG